MEKDDFMGFTLVAISCILVFVLGACTAKQWEDEEDKNCCTCCNECIKESDKE